MPAIDRTLLLVFLIVVVFPVGLGLLVRRSRHAPPHEKPAEPEHDPWDDLLAPYDDEP